LDWLRTTIKRETIDFLLPTDDDTLKIIVAHQDDLRKITRLVVPPQEEFKTASNKALTYSLAEKLGISYPKTTLPDLGSDPHEQDVLKLTDSFTYPILLKPKESSGSRGIRVAYTQEEFISYFREVHKSYPNPLLQEWIPPGPKYDVCVFFDHEGHFFTKGIEKLPESNGTEHSLSQCLSFASHGPMGGTPFNRASVGRGCRLGNYD
jgi:carbamoylphosphate synthase large subunit